MAVTLSGARPRRARRATVSRTRKPQSIRMRVSPTSTTRPLPSLPLPNEAKRTPAPRRLLQLVAQQREDALARLRAIRIPRRILHAHRALGRRAFGHLDPILLGLVLVVVLAEHVHQLRQKALLAVLARH